MTRKFVLGKNLESIAYENEAQILFSLFFAAKQRNFRFAFFPRREGTEFEFTLRSPFFFFVTFEKTDFHFHFRFSFSYRIWKTDYKSFFAFCFRPMAVKLTFTIHVQSVYLGANQFSIVRSPSLGASTALYFCHGVFTDKSIFSLNLPRTRGAFLWEDPD